MTTQLNTLTIDVSDEGLHTFDQLWSIKAEWFEDPNIRRGGWSGVIKYKLNTIDGLLSVFIKRQENHCTKTWQHPFKGIPTFLKEAQNIQVLQAHQIPTLDLVYFSSQHQRAILITEELSGFKSLEEISPHTLSSTSKNALLKKVAKVIANMHKHHLQHNALYPKHIFVKSDEKEWDVRLIDLEKMKRTFTINQAALRDLSTLDRHCNSEWSTRDRVFFLRHYLGETYSSKRLRRIWRKLIVKDKHKRR